MSIRFPRLILLSLTACLTLGALSVASPAWAGKVEEAERIRLTEEMRRLAKRNAWKGVEASYQELEVLEQKGLSLSFEEHFLGAQAARALGNINDVHERLRHAVKAGGGPEKVREAIEWLSDIDANYGRVDLVNKTRSEALLAPLQMPFAPDQRHAIEAAAQEVLENGRYVGLLPAGEYTFGTSSVPVKAITDSQDEDIAECVLQEVKGEGPAVTLLYWGLRGNLGAIYTAAGSGGGDGDEPGAFGGAGPRVGVGMEAGFSERWGVLGEFGYHGLFSGSPLNDPDVVSAYHEAYGDGVVDKDGNWGVSPLTDGGGQMHALYFWLAGSARFGALALALGPVYSAVVDSRIATLIEADTCAGDAGCLVEYAGSSSFGGAALGVSYGLLQMGSYQGGLALNIGSQTDTSRMYNWAQVGLTLSPALPSTSSPSSDITGRE